MGNSNEKTTYTIEAILKANDSGFSKTIRAVREDTEKLKSALDKMDGGGHKEGLSRLTKNAEEFASGIQDATKNTSQFKTALDQTASAAQGVDQLGEALDEVSQSAKQMGKAIDGASGESAKAKLDQTGDSVKQVGDEIEASNQKAHTFKQTMLGMAAAQVAVKALSATWQLVKGAIGGALDRLDTMDRFQRTITLMTHDSRQAGKALEDLKRISKGTAYGLDTMARGVQGFVSSSYGVKEATDYMEGWGNALATFGDGNDETLARVTIQLQQMAAKGKVNLGDLKSAMEANIPVLQIYSEATGQSVGSVSQSISDGELKTRDFMATMNKAFKEGTDSFPALINTAKQAGDSWSGTFSNMRAAVKRGVGSIVTSIENARKSAKMSTMKEAVAKFGKVTEKALNGVAKVAGFASKHFNTLATVIGTLVARSTLYKWIGDATNAFKSFTREGKAGSLILKEVLDVQSKAKTATDAYNNVLKTQAGALQISQAAEKLGIELKKTDLTLTSQGTALTEAQKAAILAETGALSAKNVIMGVLTGQIKLTTLAQTALNAAWKANPIGVVVSGVTLAVGAFKLLSNVLFKESEAEAKAREEREATVASLKTLNDESRTFSTRSKEATKVYQDNSKEAKRYIDILRKSEKAYKTNTERVAANKTALEGLKRIYPSLKGSVNEFTGAFDGNLKVLERQADLMSQNEAFQTYVESAGEAEEKIRTLTSTLETAEAQQKAMQENDQQYIQWGVNAGVESKEYKELTENIETAKASLQALQDQREQLLNQAEQIQAKNTEEEMALQRVSEAYGLTEASIQSYAERSGQSYEAVAQAVSQLATEQGIGMQQMIDGANAYGLSIEAWVQKQEHLLEEAQTSYDNFFQVAGNGYSAFQRESGVSLDDFTKNLQTNTEAMRQWSEDMQTLAALGIDQGILDTMQSGSPQAMNQAREFVLAFETLNDGAELNLGSVTETVTLKVAELNESLAEADKAAVDAVKNAMDTSGIESKVKTSADAIVTQWEEERGLMKPRLEEIGGNIRDDIVKPFDEMGEKITGALEGTDEKLKVGLEPVGKQADEFATELTNKTEKTGQDVKQKLGEGLTGFQQKMEDEKPNIELKANNINEVLQTPYRNLLSEFTTYGENIGKGLVIGMDSQLGNVQAASHRMASATIKPTTSDLEERSPSRVFERIGRYTVEGLVKGINGGISNVEKASHNMAQTAIRAQTRIKSVNMTPRWNSQKWSGYSLNGAPGAGRNNQKQALSLNLNLGGRDFRAFSNDVAEEADKMIKLEAVYGLSV